MHRAARFKSLFLAHATTVSWTPLTCEHRRAISSTSANIHTSKTPGPFLKRTRIRSEPFGAG
ncbi:hypothetical protein K443DRAFT_445357 [Laccaria amethystina LaAM-08-1]|uniref:Secreted protein n=1 Tax=Laccaria amethystina LaAM-08-1 TaxID=1095629 RepID=A0A0C9X397_9AGAR|nr:hypothetical protein K443DRAFT_445357 [Laccaria amethystina LaAM-08-1]